MFTPLDPLVAKQRVVCVSVSPLKIFVFYAVHVISKKKRRRLVVSELIFSGAIFGVFQRKADLSGAVSTQPHD
jgi:hypothetical protein